MNQINEELLKLILERSRENIRKMGIPSDPKELDEKEVKACMHSYSCLR